MARQTEVVLVTTDTHCGHYTGLTPEDWWWPKKADDPGREKIAKYQRWAWKTYKSYLKELGPFTKHINLGDCIDGKGTKSGGTELLTSDRAAQCGMAVKCIEEAGVKDIIITKGTTYHAGADEDWEEQVAKDLNAKIGCHEYIDVNGVVISARHFVGGTQNPKSKATSILGSQVENDQWCREYKEHPRADIFIRGHVHRSIIIDEPETLSIVCPGLQGWTKFGAKICGLFVHFGIIAIEIKPSGSRSCRRLTAKLGKQVHVTKW